MPKQTLKQDLERLRAELAASAELDVETRESLATLAEEIESVLHEDRNHVGSIADRVERAALRFEAEHPSLARILSEVTDTLTKLGV